MDADQRCGSAEPSLLLLLSEQRLQQLYRLLVLLVLLVVGQFRQLDELLDDHTDNRLVFPPLFKSHFLTTDRSHDRETKETYARQIIA